MSDVTRIVVADEHFLYLPLYYARHKGYFGLLPQKSEIRILRSTLQTDASAYSMLMDEESPQHRGIDFAVCDPAYILSDASPRAHPVVLAGLVTNSAFWAVNHKANRATVLKDLATFDEIISFKKGTTSYGIASRIFQNTGKTNAIVPVNPKEELSLLISSKPGTVALSPDILNIQHILETTPACGIELALSDTEEYRDMLVTALLSRRDVLERKAALVRGLLKALQIALVSVRNSTEDVIEYAVDRFGRERDTIKSALAKARRAQVYPSSIVVLQPTWLKLAEALNASWGKRFDDEARKLALQAYRFSVESFSSWADDAAKEVEGAVVNPTPLRPPYPIISIVAAVIPIVAAALLCGAYTILQGPLPWQIYGPLAVVVIASTWGAQTLGVRPWGLVGINYWAAPIGIILSLIALGDSAGVHAVFRTLFGLDLNTSLSAAALVGLIITLTLREFRYVERLRHRKKRE